VNVLFVLAIAGALIVAVPVAARWLYRVVWLADDGATDPDDLVVVLAPGNKLEADIAADALRRAGVPVYVREHRAAVATYYGFGGESYFGDWEVRVRDADLERAIAVLEEDGGGDGGV
jgi:hypothetical protein